MRSTKTDEIESDIEHDVCEYARGRGWLVRKIAYIGRRSACDRIFIRAGRVVFIEFKRRGKEPGIHQAREHRRLRNHGAEVYVVDNVEDGYAILA